MSEIEKRLREWLAGCGDPRDDEQALADLDALIAEHRAEVEASEVERKKLADRLERAVENVGTIASARQYVDAEKVREVLLKVGAFSTDPAHTEHGRGVEYAVREVARRLGVDLSDPGPQS